MGLIFLTNKAPQVPVIDKDYWNIHTHRGGSPSQLCNIAWSININNNLWLGTVYLTVFGHKCLCVQNALRIYRAVLTCLISCFFFSSFCSSRPWRSRSNCAFIACWFTSSRSLASSVACSSSSSSSSCVFISSTCCSRARLAFSSSWTYKTVSHVRFPQRVWTV